MALLRNFVMLRLLSQTVISMCCPRSTTPPMIASEVNSLLAKWPRSNPKNVHQVVRQRGLNRIELF